MADDFLTRIRIIIHMNVQKVKSAISTLKGFKMEMLGVMFFGMMLQRTFMGMLKPAMELFGVFDIFRVMLQTLFLPIMSALFPVFLALMESIMSLSPEMQFLIGVFTVLGVVIGTVLMVAGQLALGIGALAIAGTSLGAVLTIVSAIGVAFVGLGLIVTGIIDVFNNEFKGIGIIITGIGVILALFIGWWALIPIAVGAATALIIEHWQGVKDFFNDLWYVIKKTTELMTGIKVGEDFGTGGFGGKGASGSWEGGTSIVNNIEVKVQDKGFFERWADDFARKQRDELMRLTS